MNGPGEAWWQTPVDIALFVVFYGALVWVVLRAYRWVERSADEAALRAFEGLRVAPSPVAGSVGVTFTTYRGLIAYVRQTTYRFWAPPDDAREALRRLHRWNVTGGWLAPGFIFIPLLSAIALAEQERAIRRQVAKPG